MRISLDVDVFIRIGVQPAINRRTSLGCPYKSHPRRMLTCGIIRFNWLSTLLCVSQIGRRDAHWGDTHAIENMSVGTWDPRWNREPMVTLCVDATAAVAAAAAAASAAAAGSVACVAVATTRLDTLHETQSDCGCRRSMEVAVVWPIPTSLRCQQGRWFYQRHRPILQQHTCWCGCCCLSDNSVEPKLLATHKPFLSSMFSSRMAIKMLYVRHIDKPNKSHTQTACRFFTKYIVIYQS